MRLLHRAAVVAEVLPSMPWFVADATRHLAEALLSASRPMSFLVRPSSNAGQYALSMSDADMNVLHAVIQQNANNHFSIPGAPDPYPTIAQRQFDPHTHSQSPR